jgi:protein-tyrosine phosphatase
MSEIVDNLFLGDIDDVQSLNFISDHNIQLIINAAEEVSVPDYANVNKVINLNWKDSLKQPISFNLLDELIETINEYLHDGKGVLVNCYAGISRSTTIIVAYMMKMYNMKFKKAYWHVIERRVDVMPNDNFILILKRYEKYLKSSIE